MLVLAREAIDQQLGALDELRSRAGTVLAATAIAASFLGASLIGARNGSFLFWAGLAGFGASLALSLFVLLPRKNTWNFGPAIQTLYDHYLNADPEEARRELIKHMAGWERSNDTALTQIYSAFTWSILTLIAGLGFWVWEIARNTT